MSDKLIDNNSYIYTLVDENIETDGNSLGQELDRLTDDIVVSIERVVEVIDEETFHKFIESLTPKDSGVEDNGDGKFTGDLADLAVTASKVEGIRREFFSEGIYIVLGGGEGSLVIAPDGTIYAGSLYLAICRYRMKLLGKIDKKAAEIYKKYFISIRKLVSEQKHSDDLTDDQEEKGRQLTHTPCGK